MKTRIAVVVVVIVVGVAIVLFYPEFQRRRDLNETLRWIEQTYNAPEGGDIVHQGHGWERHYESFSKISEEFHTTFSSLGRCNVEIHTETLPVGVWSETPSKSDYSFNLRDIDPNSIKIKTFDLHKDVFDCSDPEQVQTYNLNCNAGEVFFTTRDGMMAISESYVRTFTKLTGADHEVRGNSKTGEMWLVADDADYAQRLAKAWKHAIELCGGRPSKF